MGTLLQVAEIGMSVQVFVGSMQPPRQAKLMVQHSLVRRQFFVP